MDADLRTDLLRKLLSIKVLDPAMGSGHFLVEATDYIAREIIHAREIARQEEGGFGWWRKTTSTGQEERW